MEIAWAANQSVGVAVETGAWHAIMSASLVVKLTLLTLVGMSVACWSIIFSKKRQFSVVNADNENFQNKFWKSSSLDAIFEGLNAFPNSTIARVFRSGYVELQRMAEANKGQPGDGPMKLSGIDNLERALTKAIDSEVTILESRLSFLATTGSSGPFIGLFGTVWGIMTAFQKIGATGMASLAVVAPGISEALIATAIGLAAAIPASIAYNHFITQIKKEELALNNFAADFLNIAKRNFFKGS